MSFQSRFPNMQVVDEPVYKSELVSGLGYMAGFYSQTSDSAIITNTTTESTLIGSGIGELSVPANTFKVGNAYTVKMGGIISAQGGDLIRFKLKADGGSIILADTGDISLRATTSNVWQMEVQFVVQQIGLSGVAIIKTHFLFSYQINTSNNYEAFGFDVTNNTTFNTTIQNTLDITAQWGQTKVQDSINSTFFNLNKIF